MMITQVVEAVGKGEALAQVAWCLNREFHRLGIQTSLVTGYVMDPPGSNTTIHVVAPSWWIGLRRTIRNFWLNKLLSILIPPSFHLLSALYICKHRGELGIVLDHTGLGGHIMIAHGCMREEVLQRWRAGERAFILYPLNFYRLLLEWLRYKLRVFTVIIAVSERTKRSLIRYYGIDPKIIQVIPNGVDFPSLSEEERLNLRNDIREKHGLPRNAFVALFVGHNFERKGLYYVLGALRHVPQCYLLVVGSGRIGKALRYAKKQGVGNRVVFTGGVHDVKPYYAASDAFILPSSYEGFPLVILEALAHGLPILVTRLGGVEEHLKDGVHGWFVSQDPQDIADKLQRLITNPVIRREMSVNNQALAQTLSWQNIAHRYLELCQKLESNVTC
jgi:glycosyltransferase involved in cell wall biosynthesis